MQAWVHACMRLYINAVCMWLYVCVAASIQLSLDVTLTAKALTCQVDLGRCLVPSAAAALLRCLAPSSFACSISLCTSFSASLVGSLDAWALLAAAEGP